MTPLPCAAAAALAFFLAGSAVAQAPVSPAASASAETVGVSPDRSQRLTVPVTIGGQGPYDFIVDTASERTVVSRELARTLNLAPGRRTTVHAMTDAERVGTVVVPQLRSGRRELARVDAPALNEVHLGGPGILGIDMLQGQRVDIDFKANTMTLSPGRRRGEVRATGVAGDGSGVIVVTARGRLGRLILADADVDGERIDAVIDTGAAVSMGNAALRRRVERSKVLKPVSIIDVTGGTLTAEYTQVGNVRIGSARIQGLPVAFSENHLFRELGLTKRPALLIGMDALRLFDRVSVDFAGRRVAFTMPRGGRMASGNRQVAGGGAN